MERRGPKRADAWWNWESRSCHGAMVAKSPNRIDRSRSSGECSQDRQCSPQGTHPMGSHEDSCAKTVAPTCRLLRRTASAIASSAGGIGRHSARGAVVLSPVPFKTPDLRPLVVGVSGPGKATAWLAPRPRRGKDQFKTRLTDSSRTLMEGRVRYGLGRLMRGEDPLGPHSRQSCQRSDFDHHLPRPSRGAIGPSGGRSTDS